MARRELTLGSAVSRLTCPPLAFYFPVQRGVRFSRNEVTPSRKSAVVRIRAFSSTAAVISRSRLSEA